jgi:ribosomal protein S18 acetylase RimI-like enzyme
MNPHSPDHDTVTLWRSIGDALDLFFRASPNHQICRLPGAVLALSGEPVADLNYMAVGAGPDPAARLREYAALVHARQLPVLVMLSAPVAAALVPVAQELGLTHAGSVPLMTHDGQGMGRPDRQVSVTQVESVADLRTATSVMARAFSLPEDAVQRAWGPALLDAPGVAIFLAYREDLPVSAVATVRHGTVVGIWCMATIPEHQRRGTGRSLLAQVMAQHQAAGARLFYLVATEAGYPLYERLGFRTVESITIWVVGHSTQVSG